MKSSATPGMLTQVVAALKGEWPVYAVNTEVERQWLEKWGKQDKEV
jgi:hypothetical protein